MKRIAIFILTIVLCLSFAPAALGEGASEALPGVGDKIGGFIVKSVTPMDVLGATGVLFEHEKNGAQLLYLASPDTNTAFDITFRTPALDDTGKAHVFEHISVCGSEKYPDPNLFFPFMNRTYNTYAGAYTYQNMTTYPIASQSEEQLMVMMDYYLAGVFMPLIKAEPRTVDREAWRYELTDAEAPLTVTGTVYSEMCGTLSSVERLANEYGKNTMFEGGAATHIAGGRPEAIQTLTPDDLIAYHDDYYHPSNALIVLYGKLDYERFIRFIDEEYISKYDHRDVNVDSGLVSPYAETVYAICQAPVEATAQTQDASYICYDFVYNDMPMQDVLGINILFDMLNNDASPLKRLAGERLPGKNVSCSVGVSHPAPLMRFIASGVNQSDRDVFVKLIDDAIAQLARGVDEDLLDATLSGVKLDLMLTCEDDDLGVNAGMKIAQYWTSFASTDYYADYARVAEEMDASRMTALARKYLLDNAYRGVTLTVPAPGLVEENAKKQADELAQKKAAMSDEEIQAMVEETKSYALWSGASPDGEIIDRFAVMTVDKLSEIQPEGELTDETVDGTRYITVDTDVNGVSRMAVYLDASSIPVDKLCDASIAASLLGNVDTSRHSAEELSIQLSRYLGTLDCALTQTQAIGEGVPDQYAFSVETLGLGENALQGYALVEEILLETEFSDVENIKNILTQRANDILRSPSSDPLNFQISRCRAMFADVSAVGHHITGPAMYKRLNELIAMADEAPERLTKTLQGALDLMLNSYSATVVCAGGKGANASYVEAAKALLKKMPLTPTTPADYSVLRLPKANEAIVNSINVHTNIIAAPTDVFTGKTTPIFRLIDDKYLVPRLRYAMGAYDAFSSDNYKYNYLCAYYDPNLAAAFEVFEGIPEYLRTAQITQEELDGYIVSSYDRMLPAEGKISQAFDWAIRRIRGISDEMYVGWMKEAKETTVADVREAANLFERMLNNGVCSVSGAESTLAEAAEVTDSIVRIAQ